jgi:DMSO reductase anchor subunit
VHPAKSVIFFTTVSGAGYGLLVGLAVLALAAALPAPASFALAGLGLALALVTAGLVASTWHLGHPERAWRALSQWRSSWLSREGVLALATYPPAVLFALMAVLIGPGHPATAGFALLAGIGALATLVATSMIYASLKAVPAWAGRATPVSYLAFAGLTGALVLHALLRLWDAGAAPAAGAAAIAFAFAAFAVKLVQWGRIDAGNSPSSAESATGLGGFGKVRLIEAPHSQPNYLMKEMGFQIARRHARALRRWVVILAFFVPTGLVPIALATGGAGAIALALVCAIAGLAGTTIERWLFFAEARHVVTFYYGGERGT